MASTVTALGLEQIRRRKGLSLQQIAEVTKISLFFLQAIESEQFSKLPGGVFNRSYIRQYAAAVGIGEQRILEAYAGYEAAELAREQAGTVQQRTRSTGLRWITSLLASVLS